MWNINVSNENQIISNQQTNDENRYSVLTSNPVMIEILTINDINDNDIGNSMWWHDQKQQWPVAQK